MKVFFSFKKIISLGVMLCIIVFLSSGCATHSLLSRTYDFEKHGDLEKAYFFLADACKQYPKNVKLQKEHNRIADKFAENLLNQVYSLNKYDLPGMLQILDKAQKIESSMKGKIKRLLLEVSSLQSEIEKKVDTLLSTIPPEKTLEGLIEVKPYLKYMQVLREKIENSGFENQLMKHIMTLKSEGNFHKVLSICEKIEGVFPSAGFTEISKTAKENICNNFVKEIYPFDFCTSSTYPAISAFLCLAAGTICPESFYFSSCFVKHASKVKEYHQNKVGIFYKGLFSNSQKEKIFTKFQETLKPKGIEVIDLKQNPTAQINLLIILNLKDAGIRENYESKQKFSTYLAGYNQIPNPDYLSAQNAYNYALTTGNNFVIIAAISNLKSTPAYLKNPVYQNYQFREILHRYTCNTQLSYECHDLVLAKNIYQDELNDKEVYTFIEREGVHSKDTKYYNTPLDPTFPTQKLEALIRGNINYCLFNLENIIDKSLIHRSFIHQKDSLNAAAMEEAFAYIISLENNLNDFSEKKFGELLKKFELTSMQKNFSQLIYSENISSFSADSIQKELLTNFTEQIASFIPAGYSSIVQLITTNNPFILVNSTERFPIIDNYYRTAIIEQSQALAHTPKNTSLSKPNMLTEALKSIVVIETDRGKGSGFFISPNGYIITNYHVIENYELITVKTCDEKKYFAEVTEKNIVRDLAILRINLAEKTPFLSLGNLDYVSLGDTVYAIGSPRTFDQTVTQGIISAIRNMPSSANPHINIEYIQTDAPINPGNSGGPLIDTKGNILGVNSYKISEGLNFAISVNELKKLFYQYLNY